MRSVLIFILLFINLNGHAQIFNYEKSSNTPRDINSRNQTYNNLLEFKKVPTIIKTSRWESILTNWLGDTDEEYFYENNLIKRVITYNYDRTDTLTRRTFSYNSDNYLTLDLVETHVGNGVYEPYKHIYYIYENNYNKMTSTEESYEKASNIWYPVVIKIEEKINNGETIRFTQYIYVLNEKRLSYGLSTTTKKLNNTTSKITEITDSLLNNDGKEYVFLKKESKSYDVNENAVSIVYSKDNNGIPTIDKIDSIYYNNNIPIETITYKFYDGISYKSYKKTNLVWKDYNTIKDYNENQLTDYTKLVFSQNSWSYSEKMSTYFTDNYNSNMIFIEEYNSNTWSPKYRVREVNNKYSHVLIYCEEKFDKINSQWDTIYGYGNNFQYDANKNITVQTQFFYNTFNLEWQNTYKWEYFNYFTISTGINTYKKTLEAKLYPNPSNNGTIFVNVNLEAASVLNIKITDMKGSVVYTDESKVGKGLNTMELHNLQQGLYIVELSTEYGVARQKLVVR